MISASNSVVKYIKESIQQGTLKPGDKLPSESELAQIIGVGRSSLREGMRILSAYGIVDVRQGDGTFIANRSGEHAFEFLGFYPSKENLRYLQQFRFIMENSCFQLAFPLLTSTDYKVLSETVEKMGSAHTLEEMIEADAKFHSFFIKKSENPIVIRVYDLMSHMLGMIFSKLMCYEEVAADAKKSHEEICSAILDGDNEAGMKAFQKHMRKIDYYAEKYISDNED